MAEIITYMAVLCVLGIGIGLGCATTTDDFREAFRNPKAVGTGLVSQYAFMPLTCLLFTQIFQMTLEQSVGCILIGCAPGGTSSNLFTYWSNGNVALSITMSFCSTMAALGMLPLLIFLLITLALDGDRIEIAWDSVFISLLLIIFPTCLGLLIRYKNTEKQIHGKFIWFWIEKATSLFGVVFLFAALGAALATQYKSIFYANANLWVAALFIQPIGSCFGYIAAYLSGQTAPVCRTISLETGVQNITLVLALVGLSFSGDKRDDVLLFVYVSGRLTIY